MEKLTRIEGSGGAICVDSKGGRILAYPSFCLLVGNYAMPFNTPGMYRGVMTSDGMKDIGIYKELCTSS